MKMQLVALDPGPEITGLAIVRYGGIAKAGNVENGLLFNMMLKELDPKVPVMVLIEDVKPYGARLSQQLINTCKWIGELEYRLKQAGIAYKLISRNTVKSWIFRTFPEISIPRIEKEIVCRNRRNKEGEYCKPHPRYVNDRMVIAAMKEHWKIETPKPGKTNRFGISKHAWQALGLASMILERGIETP